MKYRWTYVDNRGKWYLRSKSYYSFGTSLHSVLQRFHDSGDQGVTTTAQAVAALEENWIKAGFSSQDEMMQALSEGKDIVEKYVDTVVAAPVTSHTILVEKSLQMDFERFALLGRIDRVDELADGTLEIIDYKSGRQSVTEDEVASDLAMCCYQLLVRESYPGRPVVASIIALRSGEKATASMSDDQVEEFTRDIVFLGTQILDRDYENMDPHYKDICIGCDFFDLCKKHPDFHVPGS
jgi:CRISPR/Cas system-associated exonuclease Cas4 (RecB family)